MYKFQISLLIFMIAFLGFSQRGKDGSYTSSAQDEIVNTFTFLISNATAPSNSISVNNNALTGANFSGPLSPGDLLLIYQVQGGTIDIDVTPTVSWGGSYVVQSSFITNGLPFSFIEFGDVLTYDNTGNYEFVEVKSISGTQTITLSCPLTKNFSTGSNNKTQVIRIPRFNDLTVSNNTSIVATHWDGVTGGVLSMEVNGTLNIMGSGEITADSSGFRGGHPVNNASTSGGPGSISNIQDRGYMGSFDPIQGSEKGEGIYGGNTVYDLLSTRYGYGAIANAGGGGGYHNAGGGGGSNVGTGNYYGYGVVDQGPANAYNQAWNLEDPNMVSLPSSGGGRGGYSHAETNNNPLITGPHNSLWGIDYRRISGGVGGHPLTYDEDRAFLGGGGGGGHGNNTYAGWGGRGGGAVFLNLYGNVTGNGTISANGGNGRNAMAVANPGFGQKNGDDGAGGAGGGGSVIINNINPLPSTINLEAKGGNGGDQFLKFGLFNNANQADGPGGGGAGGLIAFSVGSPNENVSGGFAGVTNSSYMTLFPVNGATGGAAGMASQSTSFYDIVLTDDTICEGESAVITAGIIGNTLPGPLVSWFDSEVGGNFLNAGSTFTTPPLSTTITFYAGSCPGTFRVPVTIVVSPEITISGIPPLISPETCAGNDGAITGLTVSGGIAPLIYEWNGVNSTSLDLLNSVGGSYTLTVSDLSGCSETVGPFVIPSSPGPSINSVGLAINDETCNGNNGSIIGITTSGGTAPLTYEWNGIVTPSADLNNAVGGNYTLVVTDANGCAATVGPFTINSPSPIVIDETNLIITDESCNGNDGSITGIIASGGSGTLTYSWTLSAATTLDLSALSSGSYTLTVTD
ncbi:SprB repeat-containing protein, partial [Brumimicrobium mesophilum]|uniref:SprB repeat-containing protein n=1 Tax=Brumimicrobium mesophilum TaxID=392717 RepID=UPI0018FE20AC